MLDQENQIIIHSRIQRLAAHLISLLHLEVIAANLNPR